MAAMPKFICAYKAPSKAEVTSPPFGVFVQAFEIFLQSKPYGIASHAARYKLVYGQHYGINRSRERDFDNKSMGQPKLLTVAVTVSPDTGGLDAMTMDGVSWRLPPKGMNIVEEPMVLSNISIKPFENNC